MSRPSRADREVQDRPPWSPSTTRRLPRSSSASRRAELRQRVATLVVQLAPSAPAGTTLDLRLDPGTTMLANQAGTLYESVPNGWLELADGRLTLTVQPTFGKP